MIASRISVLVNIGRIDGELAKSELALILGIGKDAGMSEHETMAIVDSPLQLQEMGSLADASEEEKFEFINDIVTLMNVDNQLTKDEINYCLKVTRLLGYRDSVLFEFITGVNSGEIIMPNRIDLKEKVQHYLK